MSLTASSITFGYTKDHLLLEGLDLTVACGQSAAIMAPSGIGKSTFLSLLGGMRKPDNGTIEIDRTAGDDLSRPSVSWVFQSMHLLPRRTVIDNVTIAVMCRGFRRRLAEQRAQDQLGVFGVSDLADRRLRSVSGGEAQRVALARCAVADPLVVLADEPTANLDRDNADHVARVLVSGFPRAAVVIATHDVGVARHADTVYQLQDRRLVPLPPP